jgi:AraC-like DNA-binding protein
MTCIPIAMFAQVTSTLEEVPHRFPFGGPDHLAFVHVLYGPIRGHLARQVAHDRVHTDRNPSFCVRAEGARLHARINGRPLALPIIPDAVTAVHPTALPTIRPRDVRVHQRERAFEIASVERPIAATQQRFDIDLGNHVHALLSSQRGLSSMQWRAGRNRINVYDGTMSPRNTAALRSANSAKVVGRMPNAMCVLGSTTASPVAPFLRSRACTSSASLANEVAMSGSAFAARFTSLVGEPAMHYVARWRMHVAVRWLKEDDVPLAEVAGRLGYESEAAFRRTFKRVIGFSPGAVRRTTAAASSRSNW